VRIELWNGHALDLSAAPSVTIGIERPSALWRFLRPTLSSLGEAFVEGHIRVEGSMHEAFRVAEILARNACARTRRPLLRFGRHNRASDRRAIEHHYDVSNDFYRLFLDRDMVYSCAYYREETDSLETAQTHKLDHILRKLMVRPGDRLLDIGCGWGALIVRAAKHYGVLATGVTLSRNQYEHARERIRAEGLEGRCSVALCDYRDFGAAEGYDKIASVGMFEHVGLARLGEYFSRVRALLKPEGLFLNHGITTSDVASGWMGLGAGEFIDRYVFPDGELPHLALVIEEMSRAGLETADVESLRRHYARTCKEWTDRLERAFALGASLAGERRLRIWRAYLAGCAHGFARGWMNVYQILACDTRLSIFGRRSPPARA
jgi:cyclopropane-fatty-acyl-phospholipid synthase